MAATPTGKSTKPAAKKTSPAPRRTSAPKDNPSAPSATQTPRTSNDANSGTAQPRHDSERQPALSASSGTGVPARYDDGIEWLKVGLRRHPWGAPIAVVVGWSGIWIAFWGAAVGMLVGILLAVGVISTPIGGLLSSLGAGQAVTFISIFSGAVLGIAAGFVAVVTYIFALHPLQTLVALIAGAAITLVLVVLSASFERLTLQMRGYRRLSRDETRRVAPLVKSVADAMDLPALPRFAMADIMIPNAWTHMRTIVLTRGLLQTLDDGEVRAILAHELQHWQSGDSVGLQFIWGASFPVALVYNLGVLIAGRVPSKDPNAPPKSPRGFLASIGWLIAWPSWIIMKLVLIPVVAKTQRTYEYDADQAAARIGLATQLCSALQKLSVFESGRTGWETVMAATHPPTELRIEALTAARPDDWEYQEEELSGPTWTEFRRIFGGLRHVTKRGY